MSSAIPQATYYIVIGKQPPDVGGSMRPISRLLQEEEDAVRQKLLTPTFEVLRRFAKRANADGLRGQLNALGVESFLIGDQDIRSHLFLFAATASRGAGGMALRDFSGQPLYCPFDDITGVVALEVERDDNSSTTLIDLHRRSTNITPRLDVSLFDFSEVLKSEGAGLEEFLALLEEQTGAEVDRRFLAHREYLVGLSRDFGSVPGMFEPPPDKLSSPYLKGQLRAANIYSLLLQRQKR